MRQAGVLAAAGIVAIEEMVARLVRRSCQCRPSGTWTGRTRGDLSGPAAVRTNIVFFDMDTDGPDATTFQHALAERGIRMLALGPRSLRAVTHYPITGEEVAIALSEMAACLSDLRR
jgi:threonine aldolase